jgi:hypothetical protein
MNSKINTVLLCVLIALLGYSLLHKPAQVGRFQQIATPANDMAFDTATGQECYIGFIRDPLPGEPKVFWRIDPRLCVDLARK